MAGTKENEIIDLTLSSPVRGPITVDLTLGGDNDPAHSRSKKKPVKKKKKPLNSQTGTASATREPSEEITGQSSIPKNDNGATISPPNATHPSPRRGPLDAEDNAHHLFYIDISPPTVPSPVDQPLPDNRPLPEPGSEPSTSKLLLPAHVFVLGSGPSLISLPSQRELEENNYIEYLDYDDRNNDIPRYFEDQSKDETKTSRLVCKNCGAEGDHKASACTIIICLTCGARNEHSTRSCPISKVCFTCGMKGHINATCPNRYSTRFRDLDKYSDCERCHSRLHRTNECPSWWRLYEYVTDEENTRVAKLREEKRTLALGNGGEGYIGDDPWCYNCGSRGHWGDDCDELPHRDHRPEEPSAFSLQNILSGPFYDPNKEPIKKPRTDNKNVEEYLGYNDWAKDIPEDVGKQSRKKNKARLERREQEQEQADDDDWFGRSGEIRIRGEARRGTVNENGTRKASKMSFGTSIVDAGRRLGIQDSKHPSLLSRISDDSRTGDIRPRGSRDRRDDRYYDRERGDHWNRSRRDRDRDREYDDERNQPRYRGGYAR